MANSEFKSEDFICSSLLNCSINILAIDTSLDTCSVTLIANHQCYELQETTPKQHGQVILSFIETLLKKAKFELPKLDLIAFTCGPGSFTGIRLGSSIVQAIAITHQLPVLPISTLQAMAQHHYQLRNHKKVLTCVDARMQDVYWGIYELNKDNVMENTIEDILISPHLIHIPPGSDWVGIGNGWEIYRSILEKKESAPIPIEANVSPHATTVALLGEYYWHQKRYVTAEFALPRYLRSDNIWKKQTSKKYGSA